MDQTAGKSAIERVSSDDKINELSGRASTPAHATPELVGVNGATSKGGATTVGEIEVSKKGWFAYFTTRNFYIVLALGYGSRS